MLPSLLSFEAASPLLPQWLSITAWNASAASAFASGGRSAIASAAIVPAILSASSEENISPIFPLRQEENRLLLIYLLMHAEFHTERFHMVTILETMSDMLRCMKSERFLPFSIPFESRAKSMI